MANSRNSLPAIAFILALIAVVYSIPSFAEGCHAYVDGEAAPEEQESNYESGSDESNDEN
jgi:hypothetical protein